MRISEILSAALEKLGPNGEYWIKRSYKKEQKDGSYKYCMLGSIEAIEEAHYTDRGRARAFLGKHLPIGRRGRIPAYNDASSRKFPQIKETMCKAIKAALKQEAREG